MFELVLAKMLDTFTDSFTCGGGGTQWLYTSSKGNLFFTLHIMGSMMGAGMTRAVFIKTAKTEGLLGGLDKEDEVKEVSDVIDPTKKDEVKEDTKDTKKTQ